MIILNQNYVIWTLKTLLFILKTIDDHIEDEELQNDINKEEAEFTNSPLGKAFEKQIKTIEDQGERQIKVN